MFTPKVLKFVAQGITMLAFSTLLGTIWKIEKGAQERISDYFTPTEEDPEN